MFNLLFKPINILIDIINYGLPQEIPYLKVQNKNMWKEVPKLLDTNIFLRR